MQVDLLFIGLSLVVSLLLVLFSWLLVIDRFALDILGAISVKYKLNTQVEGVWLAFGSSMMEWTTNIVGSCTGNLNWGIGNICGSGAYAFTMLFGISSLFVDEIQIWAGSFFRDCFVYCASVWLLVAFVYDNTVELYQALIITGLYPIYWACVFGWDWLYVKRFEEDNLMRIRREIDEIIRQNFLIQGKGWGGWSVSGCDYEHEKEKEKEKEVNEDIKEAPCVDSGLDFTNSNEKYDGNSWFITEQTPQFISDHYQLGCATPEDEAEEEDQYLMNNNLGHLPEEKDKTENPKIMQYYNKVYHIYQYVIPVSNKYPILCFIFILSIIFAHSYLWVLITTKCSNLININESLWGITWISWAGNIGDTINAIVLVNNKKTEIFTTTIISAQIMNIQWCLGLPWLIAISKEYFTTKTTVLVLPKGINPHLFFMNSTLCAFTEVLVLVVITIWIIWAFRLRVTRVNGLILIFTYVSYLSLEIYWNTYNSFNK